MINSLKNRFLLEIAPHRLLPTLAAGFILGPIAVTIATAFAALLFAGKLSAYIPAGLGFMLLGYIIVSGLTPLLDARPGLITDLQDSPVVILALVSTAIVSSMPTAPLPETFATVVAAIALATILTGLVYLGLGQFKLGNLIRFIPYPVIGGFLAGSGLLLTFGGLSVLVDTPVSLSQLVPLVQPDLWLRWVSGLGLAVLLLAVLRRYSHFLIMPGLLAAAITVFYIILWLTQTPVALASAQGWLLKISTPAGGGLWQPLDMTALGQIHWAVVVKQLGSMGAVVIVSVIGLLLNATGVELATGEDIDLNHQLKVTGLSNILAGLAGSTIGHLGLGDSLLAHKMGAKSRLVGLVVAAICGLALLAGASILSFFPTPVIGGLIVFLGLDLLVTWVYDAWFKLPPLDYGVVILILVVINTIGFLEGIGLGLVLAVILFIVDYSRVSVVRHTLSGVNYQSNVSRPRLYEQLLQKKGEWLYILQLQGFIFFGTANTLLEQVRQRLADTTLPAPRYILLDFRLISGLDSSAVLSFVRMKQLAQSRRMVLIFTHLSPKIQRQLSQELFTTADAAVWRIFPDLDHGAEWAEDQMIDAFASVGFNATPKTLIQQLKDTLPASVKLANLMNYLERLEVNPAECLIRQGDPPSGLYFLEAGQMTVQLQCDDDKMMRLHTLHAGTIIGELGLYLRRPASASVVADQPSMVYRLSADKLKQMEESDPAMAAAFHKFIVCVLGERLASMNDTLQALSH